MACPILFDLDGTLVDSLGDIAGSVNHVRGTFELPPLPEADVRKSVGDGVHFLMKRTFPSEVDLGEALVRFRAHYLEHCLDRTRPFDGVTELLEELSAAGHPLALCTNKPESYTLRVVRGLGLERFFGAILSGDSLPTCKPDPAMLNAALERLASRRQDAVMVGDGTADILAARAAGLPVIALSYGLSEVSVLTALEPDRMVDSVAGLREALLALS